MTLQNKVLLSLVTATVLSISIYFLFFVASETTMLNFFLYIRYVIFKRHQTNCRWKILPFSSVIKLAEKRWKLGMREPTVLAIKMAVQFLAASSVLLYKLSDLLTYSCLRSLYYCLYAIQSLYNRKCSKVPYFAVWLYIKKEKEKKSLKIQWTPIMMLTWMYKSINTLLFTHRCTLIVIFVNSVRVLLQY